MYDLPDIFITQMCTFIFFFAKCIFYPDFVHLNNIVNALLNF